MFRTNVEEYIKGMRYAVRFHTKGGELDDTLPYGDTMNIMNSFRKRKKAARWDHMSDNQSKHEHMQEKCLDFAWQKKKQDWQSLTMWAQVVVDICLPPWLEPQWNLIRIDGVT